MIITRIADHKQFQLESIITPEEKLPAINVNKGFPLRCAIISCEGKKHFLKFVLKKECSMAAWRAASDAFARELKFQMHYPGIVYVEDVSEYMLAEEEKDAQNEDYADFLATIGKLTGNGQSAQILGLTEEYAGSRSLGDVYAQTQERVSDEILFRHIYRMLDAICAYYRRFRSDPLLHRDIKPDNVMVGQELSDIAFVDFDISHVKGSSETRMRGTFGKGTPGYAHPRQTQAEAGMSDIRIDFYGLGMTILYMLCGQDYLISCGFTEDEIDSWTYIDRPSSYHYLYKVRRDNIVRNGDRIYQGKRYEGLLDLVDLLIADDTEDKGNIIRDPEKMLTIFEDYLRSIYGKDYVKIFRNTSILSYNADQSGKTAVIQFYSYKKGARILTVSANNVCQLNDDSGRQLGLLYRAGDKVECLISDTQRGVIQLGNSPYDFETGPGHYRLRLIRMSENK